jgi:hypothetical protein
VGVVEVRFADGDGDEGDEGGDGYGYAGWNLVSEWRKSDGGDDDLHSAEK